MAAPSDLVSRAFLHPIKMFVRVSGRVRSLAAQCGRGYVDQIACRCPSLSRLPAHWVDTARQLLRVGPPAPTARRPPSPSRSTEYLMDRNYPGEGAS